MSVKLLTEHHLEFLSLKGGCIGSTESTRFKIRGSYRHLATSPLISRKKIIENNSSVSHRVYD